MKKFYKAAFAAAISVCSLVTTLCFTGCNNKMNYADYISEARRNIYVYSSDECNVKINYSEKETPYLCDGIKGNISKLLEIYVTLPKTYSTVTVSAGDYSGEMNYLAVEGCYYLSFSGDDFKSDNVNIKLTYGENTREYTAMSVLYDGVISCEDALLCAVEYDGALFESLTEKRLFNGEIYTRLLFDEGCYYYVGVCDKNKNINAYLVDGEHGKIIATKKITA